MIYDSNPMQTSVNNTREIFFAILVSRRSGTRLRPLIEGGRATTKREVRAARSL